jgi:D-glycero-D-manno-heptose 1,7-bisphosphate phosphatase
MNLQPAIFLDRDGTLMEEAGYCANPAQVRVFPYVPEALQALREAGYLLILITNQSGIGRGYFTEEAYRAVEAEFERQIHPAYLDAVYFCPDAPDIPSTCRKPAAGMIQQAARDHSLDLARSFMIGDKSSDIECGLAAGCRSILVLTGYGKEHAHDNVADDFPAAARLILELSSIP